jgi:hypothetical protein
LISAGVRLVDRPWFFRGGPESTDFAAKLRFAHAPETYGARYDTHTVAGESEG